MEPDIPLSAQDPSSLHPCVAGAGATVSSIAELVRTEGGRVTFARFMEIALTHSTLGYYSRVDRLLRYGGDFSTAPALSPFFNQTVARLVTELVEASLAISPQASSEAQAATPIANVGVVELGGGEGHLAAGILSFWERERPKWRELVAYRVVEVGSRLRERQMAAVGAFTTRGWDVGWGSDLAEACADIRPVVMVGNEFLDALPVHLIDVRERSAQEAYVEVAAGLPQTTAETPVESSLALVWGDLSDVAAAEIDFLFGTRDPRSLEGFSADGILEIFPGLAGLMRNVARLMPSGSLVNIDYGEWFPGLPASQVCSPCALGAHVARRRTVRGYFRHQMEPDPLARPGRQDLTADVDFAAVDLHGRREGFETVVFTTLAALLRGGGAAGELRALRDGSAETASDPLEADRQATVLDRLLDEQGLGRAFKVMVQVRE